MVMEITLEKSTGMLMKAKDKAKISGMICDPSTGEPKYWLLGSWLSHIDIEKYDPKKKSWGET